MIISFAGPAIGSKRPADTGESPVNSKKGQPQGPPKKKGRKQLTPQEQLDKLLSHDALGTDNDLEKSDKRPILCTVLMEDIDSEDGPRIFKDVKYRYEPFSQNALVTISQQCILDSDDDSFQIDIGYEHMRTVGGPVSQTIKRRYIDKDQVNKSTILEALTALEMSQPNQDVIDHLQKHSGFAAFAFTAQSNAESPLQVHRPKGFAFPKDHEFRELVKGLRQGTRVAIVRNNFPWLRDKVDKFWDTRLERIIRAGTIYPDFEPDKLNTVYDGPKEWEETNLLQFLNGNQQIPFAKFPWMRKPKPIDDPDAKEEYGHFQSKTRFTSLAEYQIVHSLALAFEVNYQRDVLDEIFHLHRQHQPTARRNDSLTWQLTIEVNVPNDVSLPAIPDDTTFKVQLRTDVEMAGSQLRVFKMTKIDVGTVRRGWFVLEWKEEKDKDVPWNNSHMYDVVLDMEFNLEPSLRSFKALQLIRDNGRSQRTELILGRNFDPVERQENLPGQKETLMSNVFKLDPDNQTSLVALLRGFLVSAPKLNHLQWAAFDKVLLSKKGTSFLQGPPGTGKSLVISVIAVFVALLRCTVVVCAPSNGAKDAISLKLVERLRLAPKVKLTIWPSKKYSDCLAREYLHQSPATPKYSSDMELLVRNYQWYSRAIKEGIRRYTEKLDGTDHDDWYKTYQQMLEKKILSSREWTDWFNHLSKFSDIIEKETDILVCTCNNLARLNTDSPDFLSKLHLNGLVIVDEARFDQEYSTAIPISLNPLHLLLVGDHQQLEPIVGSWNCNFFAPQVVLSAFQRCITSLDVDFVILKVTYRLPHRLANFPGDAAYGGLLHRERKKDVQVWQDYQTWFNGSKYKALRRSEPEAASKSKFQLADAQDPSRVFLNLHGRSAKSPHSHSTVNYANINAICDYITAFTAKQSFPEHKGKVVVLVPFSA